MPSQMRLMLLSWLLVTLGMLATAIPAVALGSVTPSFGNGNLILIGDGYRAGEQVEISIQVASATHQFTATADARGRFRLDTGLAVPPFSSLQIEARDEQGQTQATMTNAPGGLPGAPAGGDGSPDSDQEADPEGADCPE